MVEPRVLFIVGAAGLAREMAQLAVHASAGAERWRLAGFIGSPEEVGHDLGFGRVVGDDEWLLKQKLDADVVIGIGTPSIRARVADRISSGSQQFKFPNLVHPSAILDRDKVALGVGNCITAGCIFTCDITVGNFNLFNLQTTVGHDCRVGSFNVVNPSVNLSGRAQVGDRILIGTGAQILEGREIGDGATVGAGAVVARNVPDEMTVVGIPARPIDR